jgi:SMC interacting uncharacterized protein involved in chromosome segregation
MGLRWITAQRMRQTQTLVHCCEEEFRNLQRELNELIEASRQVAQAQRQCALKRARLLEDISLARAELEELRRPAGRLAA